MMGKGRRKLMRTACVAFAGVMAAVVLAVTGSPADAANGTLPRAEGAGPPVKASGMGTQAALDNPRCTSGEPEYGPYGRFDTAAVGQGPSCVKVWKAGDDNGGATATGVTKDRIKVVAYLPNEEQFSKDPVPPMVRATKTKGTHVDGIHDYLVPTMRFYETWGRGIEMHFVTSSGSDEAAQRADAVTIKAMKPFAAVMISSNEDKSVLESLLAASKIMTFGYNASPADSAQQSPYRWNSADNDAVAINAAEVLGKQIVGKKAEHGGDDVNGQPRKVGIVHSESLDYDAFVKTFKRYEGGEVEAAEIPLSPPEAIQSAAPTIITRMKAAGVTTIVPFVGSSPITALMEFATQQDYFPEWFFTGASYQDIAILARNYPQDQAEHAFGISFIAPWIEPDPVPATGMSNSQKIDALNWYWGLDAGTYTQRYGQALGYWLLGGVHAAGPKLTPKTFKQGLFATPGRFGAYEGRSDGIMVGFGKAPKLPYDSYATAGYDFAPWWWDPDTEGASNGTGTVGQGVGQFVDGGKRYVATTWPRRPFAWFDDATSIVSFDARPGGPLEYAGDCDGCPSTGGPGEPGAPSDSMVVFDAGGTGASAGSS
jgi:hypothetical protein